jgi:MOSC domain-containing protein YiiM
MKVRHMFIRDSKDDAPREISRGEFVKDFGLKGDAKAGPGERQVCVITREGRDAVNADHRDGLCFRRFKETLELDEATEPELKPGAEFDIGPVRFRVSQAKKRCFENCAIVRSGSICALPGSVRYLKVLRGGVISSSD